LANVTPWAATHPEQHFDVEHETVRWRTTTYGSDIGVVVRLADLAAARFHLQTAVHEDGLSVDLEFSGSELIDDGYLEATIGGLNLRVRAERVAESSALPTTVTGDLVLDLPYGTSAAYVRATQSDGHQVWTSPLFVTRSSSQTRCPDPA
jgi:hypothetical protein